MPCRAVWCCLLSVGLAVLGPAGQSLAVDAPEVSVRGGVWSHARDFKAGDPVAIATLAGRWAQTLSPSSDVYVEGWVSARAGEGGRADLREAWVRWTHDVLEVRAGRQIIVWGRADRLNPTDVIGSRDYTRLTASDEAQRRGVFTVSAAVRREAWSLTGYWLPEFRPNVFPLDTRTSGLFYVSDAVRRDHGQFGVRLDRMGSDLEGALYFFQGIDRTREFALLPPPQNLPVLATLQQQFPDVRVVGADLAGTAGRIGFRAEVAWADVSGGAAQTGKRDSLWAVAGADTDAGDWNLNLQVALKYVPDPVRDLRLSSPLVQAVALRTAAVNNQLERWNSSVTFRAARGWLQETLQFELATQVNLEHGDAAIRPKLTYAMSDHARCAVGADVFLGPESSYFGQVRDLSAVWLELAWGF